MNILLAAFGTHGDVRPIVDTAEALTELGHYAHLILNPTMSDLAEQRNLPFTPAGPAQPVNEFLQKNPDIVTMKGGTKLWDDLCLPQVKPMYQVTLRLLKELKIDYCVTHPLCVGARWAANELGVKSINTHMAGTSLRSQKDPSQLTQLELPRFLRPWFNLFIHTAFNHITTKTLKPLAEDLGLDFKGRSFADTFENNYKELCFWPEEYRPRASDDPDNAFFCGFPLPIKTEPSYLSKPTVEFLKEHPNPIVVGLGSGLKDMDLGLYRRAALACAELNKPCILVGCQDKSFQEEIPNVHLTDSEPYSELFPHAELVIHHGGIGTTADVFRAGIPAIIIPFMADQFDNAEISQRLGLAIKIPRKQSSVTNIREKLQQVRSNQTMLAKSKTWSEQLASHENGALVAAKVVVAE